MHYHYCIVLYCGDVSAVTFSMRRSEVDNCGVVGYEGSRGESPSLMAIKVLAETMCVIEKPECERFVCPVVYHPPLFRHSEVPCPFIVCASAPLLCVQFDGSVRALMRD